MFIYAFLATKILILCSYSQIQQALCLRLSLVWKVLFFCSGDYRRCPDYQSYVQDVGTLMMVSKRGLWTFFFLG